MRTTGKKRTIRYAPYRLGLHATPKAAVHALMRQSIRNTLSSFVANILAGTRKAE